METKQVRLIAALVLTGMSLRAALEEVDVGLAYFIDLHGDRKGRLASLRDIIQVALARTEGEQP
jgi:hypothetical protein